MESKNLDQASAPPTQQCPRRTHTHTCHLPLPSPWSKLIRTDMLFWGKNNALKTYSPTPTLPTLPMEDFFSAHSRHNHVTAPLLHCYAVGPAYENASDRYHVRNRHRPWMCHSYAKRQASTWKDTGPTVEGIYSAHSTPITLHRHKYDVRIWSFKWEGQGI